MFGLCKPKEALIKQMRKLLWRDQWRQDLDFIDPRVAQLRWLAIKRGFIQRLPNARLAVVINRTVTLCW
jgi:hypothetical protein